MISVGEDGATSTIEGQVEGGLPAGHAVQEGVIHGARDRQLKLLLDGLDNGRGVLLCVGLVPRSGCFELRVGQVVEGEASGRINWGRGFGVVGLSGVTAAVSG